MFKIYNKKICRKLQLTRTDKRKTKKVGVIWKVLKELNLQASHTKNDGSISKGNSTKHVQKKKVTWKCDNFPIF